MRIFRSKFLALIVLVGTATPVWAAGHSSKPHKKFDQSLQKAFDKGCSGNQAVIIRTKPDYRSGLSESLRNHGNNVSGEFASVDAVAAKVSCQDLATLEGFDSVRSVSADSNVSAHQLSTALTSLVNKVTSSLQQATAAAALQAPLFQTLLGASTATSSSTSTTQYGSYNTSQSSVGVAVIDSGIAAGLDFDLRITASYDFTHGDIRAVRASDEYGHGSHVAGLIASKFVGLAPSTHLIALKVLDANGQGSTSNVMRAIEFAVLNRDRLGIRILNLSLGHPIYESAATDPLVQAVESATRAGITVVVSAGNFGANRTTGATGYAGIASPGNAPSALTVGSVRTFDTPSRLDDRVAAYSSRGPSWFDGFAKPDIVAPGDNLLSVASDGSLLRLLQEQRGNTGNYMRLSGTSMAAGVATGLAALVLQANPGLTPNALKAVLEYTAVSVSDNQGKPYDVLTQGAGSLNGVGALTLARSIDTRTRLGQKWLTNSLVPSTNIAGQLLPWSQAIIWGNHIARGKALLSEQRPAWALNVTWGVGLENDDNIVWGNWSDDNIVWGNNFDLGDNIVWGNNIVWQEAWNAADDNIVWGNWWQDDNIVWGNCIVWGSGLLSFDGDNIVWGNWWDDNIVWGNWFDDNIVWGNWSDDNIVWGNSSVLGTVLTLGSEKGAV